MTWRRTAFVVAVGIVMVTSTGGFSSITAEHPGSVRVAGDEAAYLAVDVNHPRLSNPNAPPGDMNATPVPFTHEGVPLLRLTNQFPGSATLSVTATVREDDEGGPDLAGSPSAPAALDVGESGAVLASVRCPTPNATGPSSETWVVAVDAAAGEDTIRLSREVVVTCDGPGKAGP